MSVLIIILCVIAIYLLWWFFIAKRCPKCGSYTLEHSNWRWNRAWNSLCEQATGAAGTRCYDCGHMMWDIPDEKEWLKTQPKWIISYNSKEYKKRYGR